MDNDEYVYRLSLDARAVTAATNSLLSLMGRADEAVDKVDARTRRLQRDLAALGRAVSQAGGTADPKATAALRRQRDQIEQITAAYRDASAGFAKYQTNVARGLQRPGGTQPARLSNTRLNELQNQSAALRANGVTQTPADRAFSTAVNAEVAARRKASDQKSAIQAKEVADTAAAQQREAAAAARANAAFRAEAQRTADQQTRLRMQLEAGSERYTQKQIADARRATAAQERAAQQQARAYEAALPRLRYALYDVANTAGVAGLGLLGVGVGILKVGADYESAYAQVKRTSDILTDDSLNQGQKNGQFARLREDLVDLSTQIPVTFQDISQIAKTGNQLGIASGNITSFTSSVAKFTAITGVDTEEAATAFGRLGEILNDTNYRAIADEIAYLGVKSVASEKDIIDTATQLAVSGQGIGLTTKQVLALSTTVAGLGVKPEQARGTFIRAFSAIGAAVNGGGEKLQRIQGLASDLGKDFKTEFDAGGGRAYNAFLSFTRGLGTSSAEIDGNLAKLGITAVRDRQTLGLLAQNGGRALKDLANASKGVGFSDTAYEVQAETITSKLTVLGNQVKAIFDEIGQDTTGPLAVVLDIAGKILTQIQAIVHSPLAGWVSAIAVGFAVLAGAGLIGAAALARVVATMITFRQIAATSIGELTGLDAAFYAASTSANVAAGSFSRAGTSAGAANAQYRILGATNLQLAASTQLAAGAQGKLASSALTTVPATGKLNGALLKLTGFLGKAGLAGLVVSLVASLPAVAEGISNFADEMSGASIEADTLEKKLQNLGDTAAGLQNLTDIRKALPGGTGDTTTIGDKFGAGFYAPLGGSDAKGRYTVDLAKGGTRGVTAVQGAVNDLTQQQRTPGGSISFANGSAQFDREVQTQLEKIKTVDTALTDLYQNGDKESYNKGLDLYLKAMKDAGVAAPDAQKALVGLEAALKSSGAAAEDAATQTEQAAQVFSDSLAAIFDPAIQVQKITGDLADLGTEAVNSGFDVAFSGEKMKSTIADIAASSDDLGVVKGRLQSLYDQLLLAGVPIAALLPLQQAIYSISATAKDAPVSIDAYTKAVAEAGQKSSETAQEVRQLSDYAGDLSSAFSRSFEIRFGTQTATDKVVSGFRDLRDSIKDSRAELKAAKADLAELNADQDLRKYQLGIATRFGDFSRAAKLRAEIAKGDTDIAAKRDDIRDAQSKNSRALTGDSEGAIANREKFRGVIQNGQDVLTAMAKNGATPAQLSAAADKFKKQLVDQGIQMGFSRKDLEKLAASYDDYKKIIDAIPANLMTKVDANTSPAQKALAEYRERLKDIDGTTVTTKVVQQAIDLAGTPLDLTADAAAYSPAKVAARSNAIDQARASRGFRDGGYTGALPRWQKAGDVHGDEFVLNSRGQRLFPRQMLEGANHGVAPQFTTVKATATLQPGAQVSLSSVDRALFAAGGGSSAVSVNADRFGSAMDGSFRRASRKGSN